MYRLTAEEAKVATQELLGILVGYPEGLPAKSLRGTILFDGSKQLTEDQITRLLRDSGKVHKCYIQYCTRPTTLWKLNRLSGGNRFRAKLRMERLEEKTLRNARSPITRDHWKEDLQERDVSPVDVDRPRRDEDREGRLRRALIKLGLSLTKSWAWKWKLHDQQGYKVIDLRHNFVAAGRDFDLSLDDVEKYIAYWMVVMKLKENRK